MVATTITFSDTAVTPPVFVAGSFTDWLPIELEYCAANAASGVSGVYKKDFDIPPGEHQYKFRLGSGDWWVCDEAVDRAYDATGNENNTLVVKPVSEQSPGANLNAGLVNGHMEDTIAEVKRSLERADPPDVEDTNSMIAPVVPESVQTTSSGGPVPEINGEYVKTVPSQSEHMERGAEINISDEKPDTQLQGTTQKVNGSADAELDSKSLSSPVSALGRESKPSGLLDGTNDNSSRPPQKQADSTITKTGDITAEQAKTDMSRWRSADKPMPSKSAMKPNAPSSDGTSAPDSDSDKTSFFYRLCCSSRNIAVTALVVGVPVYFSWLWLK